jgi:ABC-2 type transport system ATP-binding protein
MPANAETVKYREQVLAPLKRKEALFYLPDAIAPWAEQTVAWVLRFFEKLYGASASEFAGPLRLPELMKSHMASLSKGERKRTLLALGLMTPQPLCCSTSLLMVSTCDKHVM